MSPVAVTGTIFSRVEISISRNEGEGGREGEGGERIKELIIRDVTRLVSTPRVQRDEFPVRNESQTAGPKRG